jgi:hypothetical protein
VRVRSLLSVRVGPWLLELVGLVLDQPDAALGLQAYYIESTAGTRRRERITWLVRTYEKKGGLSVSDLYFSTLIRDFNNRAKYGPGNPGMDIDITSPVIVSTVLPIFPSSPK